jgi:hypothetical protein
MEAKSDVAPDAGSSAPHLDHRYIEVAIGDIDEGALSTTCIGYSIL